MEGKEIIRASKEADPEKGSGAPVGTEAETGRRRNRREQRRKQMGQWRLAHALRLWSSAKDK